MTYRILSVLVALTLAAVAVLELAGRLLLTIGALQ
jgi:hypothetical protein